MMGYGPGTAMRQVRKVKPNTSAHSTPSYGRGMDRKTCSTRPRWLAASGMTTRYTRTAAATRKVTRAKMVVDQKLISNVYR